MARNGNALTPARSPALVLTTLLIAVPLTGSAQSGPTRSASPRVLTQLGPMHVPPIRQRPFSVHAELIDRGGLGHEDTTESPIETLGAFRAPTPPFSLISEVTSHVVFQLPLRLERPDHADLLLTFVGRDRRRVRVRLEEEGAPSARGRTLTLFLDRAYGVARGRLVTALGPTGPWLRIDLHRP